MKKQHTMERIFEMMPALDMTAVDKWTEDVLFRRTRYVTVQRQIKGYICTCRYCGKSFPIAQMQGETRHNKRGVCPKCGSSVTVKDNWRGHKTLVDEGYFLVVQKMRNRAALLRSFYVDRTYDAEWKRHTSYSEHMRIYVHPQGIRTFVRHYWGAWYEQKSVGKPLPYNFYQSKTDYHLGIKWETDLKNTLMKYSCAREYVGESDFPPDLTKYLELYVKYPVLTERLMKQGFESLITEKISGKMAERAVNFRKETVHEALGVPKSALGELKHCTGEDVLKKRLILEYGVSNSDDIEFIKETPSYQLFRLTQLLKLMTVYRLRKYLGSRISAEQKKQPFFSVYTLMADYGDYISQCKALKFNVKEPNILFPSSLSRAHEQATQLLTQQKAEQKAQAERERDEKFFMTYKKLSKKYSFSADGLLVRPAEGAGELCREGMLLNHCVYTNYADRYLAGECIILVIRRESEPEKPFYTVELSTGGTLIQCRGNRNCGQTPEVKAFTEKWLKHLEESKKIKAA